MWHMASTGSNIAGLFPCGKSIWDETVIFGIQYKKKKKLKIATVVSMTYEERWRLGEEFTFSTRNWSETASDLPDAIS